MEEKKRRPRISKTDSDTPENEQGDGNVTENQSSSEQTPSEKKPWQDRESGPPSPNRRPYDSDRPSYPNRERNEGGGGGGYNRRPYDSDRPSYPNRERNESGGGGGYNRERSEGGGGYNRRPYDSDRPSYPNRERNEGGGGGGYNRERSEGGGGYNRRPYDGDRPSYPNRERNESGGGGGYNRERSEGGGGYNRRPYDSDRPSYPNRDRNDGGGKPFYKKEGGGKPFNKRDGGKKPFRKKLKDEFELEIKPKAEMPSGVGMPLNKYMAHCGLSSRRQAVELITAKEVRVNGEVKTEPFYRIQEGDVVTCQGKTLTMQEKMVYVLLNKPKNVITTTDDEKGRYTVLDIVDPHYPERIYPVGRLDRDTTGLVLLTNDGDLSEKLTHPRYRIQKQYRVGLRTGLSEEDLELIQRGVKLEDGVVEVNWIRFAEDKPDRNIVEMEITSGRNRIIRRLFEALGYEVYKLDRFYIAGLTKKDLPRGAFRNLTDREVIMLKYFTGHPSTTKKMLDDAQGDAPDAPVADPDKDEDDE